MKGKTLYEELYEATRSVDIIIQNIDNALEFLEEMKRDGIDDWRLEPAVLELKDAKNRLGINVF
ncbi:hypothetical protein MXL46_11215 [Heyndrickxia sporothermodurans]|uniref:hypothetical protein n=1 Tax=Heyndrickxia sporothermodurans TaxID=46224 RepID=UPI002DBAC3C4|nr:hypothetical protein [Heyndrickxia sporothermodurans]MEB6549655.1 hypothetical protein [Heyndrickxia sporothermodurans]